MRSKRDVAVELARVVACLIVIGVHVKLPSLVGDSYSFGRILISCLVSDGVALFWFISGFFLFESRSYRKLLDRTLTHVLVPALALGIVSFVLQGVMSGGILGGVIRPASDYLDVAWGFLCWENPFQLAPHLWYIFTYALVVLCFPILKVFSNYLAEQPRRERIFLLVSLLLLACNDLTRNATFEFSHHGITALVPAAFEMLCGRIVYRHRDQLMQKFPLALAPLLLLATNVVRALLQQHDYLLDPSMIHLSRWYSIAALISVLCIFRICFAWGRKASDSSATRLVVTLGSYTYPVYLVHYLFVGFFDTLGITALLQRVLPIDGTGPLSFVFSLCYTIIMIGLVFACALVTCAVLRRVRALFSPKGD